MYSDTFAPEAAPGFRYASYGALGSNAPPRARRPARGRAVPLLAAAVAALVRPGQGRRRDARRSRRRSTASRRSARRTATRWPRRAARASCWRRSTSACRGCTAASCRRASGSTRWCARRVRCRAIPHSRVGEVERGVAANVAGLIPDGATLQFGDRHHRGRRARRARGPSRPRTAHRDADRLRAAAPRARRGDQPPQAHRYRRHRERRLHRRRERCTGTSTATRRCGSPGRSTRTRSRRSRASPVSSASIRAVEVDLGGNVNAEVAGGAYVGGFGGQLDFVRGAAAAPGGRAIIALPSVSRDGKASRIVARCAAVTTPAADADTIVTEWGVAELRGVSYEERARRIAAIAHPAFRDALASAARW